MDQTRLGVGIVGTGRVGAVMGRALREAGHTIVGCTASSEASRDRASAMLPDVPILDVETVVERSELVLFTVPDDILPELVSGLAKLGKFNSGQIVAHCAGRYGTEVLEPSGAIPLALHPSLSFTGTSIDLPRLRQATIADGTQTGFADRAGTCGGNWGRACDRGSRGQAVVPRGYFTCRQSHGRDPQPGARAVDECGVGEPGSGVALAGGCEREQYATVRSQRAHRPGLSWGHWNC